MNRNVATTCRDIKELNPLAQVACNLFLSECNKRGINIFITETYRSQDRQNYLFAQGRTEPGKVVTWTTSSRHTSRMAWDIACKGNDLYDVKMLKQAGEVAKSLGITWGGTWSKPDMPHFEITASWKSPIKVEVKPVEKEDEDMAIKYNKLEEVPSYAKATISKLIAKGVFADTNNLKLSEEMLRIYVTHDRLGLYK